MCEPQIYLHNMKDLKDNVEAAKEVLEKAVSTFSRVHGLAGKLTDNWKLVKGIADLKDVAENDLPAAIIAFMTQHDEDVAPATARAGTTD